MSPANQGELFATAHRGRLVPRQLARTTDPPTSHAAARQIVPHLGRLQQQVYVWIMRSPDKTATELAAEHGIGDPRVLNRRISELHAAGVIVVSGERECRCTGRAARTWRTA